ncbi:MAG: quinone-dependent dihydroorotate dehydrogenase [Microgenomates group bacterium]
MFATSFFRNSYKHILKPILFLFDAELVHDGFTYVGEKIENLDGLVSGLFRYSNPNLKKTLLGVTFDNPIGLAAGFDYDGHMARVMKHVGFGFNTVGTVTAIAYEGNTKPRLARLPMSQSLLVNKGFKSGGAIEVRARLDAKNLKNHTIGISVGSSNLPQIDTLKKAIDDYLYTFKVFAPAKYVKYFELNISCPNIRLKGAFSNIENFSKLCSAVKKLKLKQPIFVKMANELSLKESDALVSTALKYGIKGFIFSNLVKDRTNPVLVPSEVAKISHLPGNFSGKPTFANSVKLIKHTRAKFGKDIVIVGTGGVFNASDAKVKFDAGADLIQLITGMIYEGPQLIGEINRALSREQSNTL